MMVSDSIFTALKIICTPHIHPSFSPTPQNLAYFFLSSQFFLFNLKAIIIYFENQFFVN